MQVTGRVTMANNTMIRLLLPLFLSCAVATQTYIVDAAIGPGSSYTSIADAVAAVPDGAVLLVRSGNYGPFAIQAKSLKVLCDTGTVVGDSQQTAITIDAIGVNQSVTIEGLTFRSQLGPASIRCSNSAGTIVLDTIRSDLSTTQFGGGLTALSCRQLHCRGCILHYFGYGPALDLSQCQATCIGCNFWSNLATPIRLGGGSCDMALTTVWAGVAANVAELTLADLVVRRGSRLTIDPSNAPGLAVAGGGTLRIDPSVQLDNVQNPPFDPQVATTTIAMPSLISWPGTLGGSATATMFCSGAGLLFVGFPGLRHILPGLGVSSLVSGSEVLVAIGTTQFSGSYAVPAASPWVLGITIGWQGAEFAPATGLQLTNVAVYSHH